MKYSEAAQTFEVQTAITNDETGERHEAGEVVDLGDEWNVEWLEDIGAIAPAGESEDADG